LDAASSVAGLTDAILVAIEQWTAAQGAYVISRGGAISWPARSPDLSVCDYLLCEYLKSRVYLTKPCDIDELRNAIKEEITATTYNIVRETMRTLRDRLEQRRLDGGKHMRDVIFKNRIYNSIDVVYFNVILSHFLNETFHM
jgi:hypothetical protein